MRAARPEVVFHLAAQSLVRPSYSDPVGTYTTNVIGTVNVLEAVRQIGDIRSVVIVTSDKCYENGDWERGYRETDAMGGYDPYSSSKGCAELVTSAFRRSYFGDGGDGSRVGAGGQHRRRRRLGARSAGARFLPRARRRRSTAHPVAGRGAAVATRAGAGRRLSRAGRGARERRQRVRRRLEFGAVRRQRPHGELDRGFPAGACRRNGRRRAPTAAA